MIIAHIGVGVTVIGVTFTSAFSIERDVVMTPGEALEIGVWEFRFDGVTPENGPNYDADRGRITIARGADRVAELFTEKRIYRVQQSPMTEAGIDAGLFRDLYVSLGEPLTESGQGAWSVRLQYKPFIRWIWMGAILMALGGLLAATDRRYRLKAKAPTDGSDPKSPEPAKYRKLPKVTKPAAAAKKSGSNNPAWKVQPKYVSNNGPSMS